METKNEGGKALGQRGAWGKKGGAYVANIK